MKKHIYITLALLSLLVCACNDDTFSGFNNNFSITCSIEPAERLSRTSMEYTGTSAVCQWEAGDTIGIFSADGAIDNVPCIASGSGSSVGFTVVRGYELPLTDGMELYAYYPYRKGSTHGAKVDVGYFDYKPWGKMFMIGNTFATASSSDKVAGFRDFIVATSKVKGGKLNLSFKHILSVVRACIGNEFCRDWNRPSYDASDNRIDIPPLSDTEVKDEPYVVYDFAAGATVWNGGGITIGKSTNYTLEEFKKEIDKGDDIILYTIFPACVADANRFIRIYFNANLFYVNVPEGGFSPGVMYNYTIGQKDLDELEARTRHALKKIYESCGLEGVEGYENWRDDVPLAEWDNIYTEYNGTEKKAYFVTELRFNGEINGGQIPEEIGDLTFLSSISTSNNFFDKDCVFNGVRLRGKLPAALGSLKFLNNLSLIDCGIEGDLVDVFPIIRLGQRVNLSFNNLTGPLPEVAPYIEAISLSYNNLTGSIPESWVNLLDNFLPERKDLWWEGVARNGEVFRGNRMTGRIPEAILNHPRFPVIFFSLEQQEGYGFDPVPVKWSTDRMILEDGSIFDLGDCYKNHEYTVILNIKPGTASTSFWYDIRQLARTFKNRGMQVIITEEDDLRAGNVFSDLSLAKEIIGDYAVYINPNMYEGHSKDRWDIGRPQIGFPLLNSAVIDEFYTAAVIDKNGLFVGAYRSTCPIYTVYNQFPFYYTEKDLGTYIANLFGDEEYNPLPNDYYTSTDYSEDGKTLTLQRASRGRGIDIVFTGTGFVDTEMVPGGRFEQMMHKKCEALFAYEPYKSLRDRFNVYAVKAVSANNEWGGGSSHAFDADDGTSYIDLDKITSYVSHAPISGEPIVAVFFNTLYGESLSRSFTAMFEDNSAFSMLFEDNDDVFVHELCGHAYGKLGDEYIECIASMDENEKDELRQSQNLGWYLNVDLTPDPSKVKWAKFLTDQRYSAEKLGVFEGAFTFAFGCYRPSENSMMNHNDCGFNAPSREIIYKRIMTQSEGSGWSYDFEDFYQFDRNNIRPAKSASRASDKNSLLEKTAPPKLIKGTWRSPANNTINLCK